MPFLRAGFNARNRALGIYAWCRPAGTREPARWCELRVFKSGDYFWLDELGRYLIWDDQVQILPRIWPLSFEARRRAELQAEPLAARRPDTPPGRRVAP